MGYHGNGDIYIYLSCQQQSTLGTQQSKLVQSAKLGRPQSNSKDGSKWPPVPKVWSYTFLFTAFNSKISRVESIWDFYGWSRGAAELSCLMGLLQQNKHYLYKIISLYKQVVSKELPSGFKWSVTSIFRRQEMIQHSNLFSINPPVRRDCNTLPTHKLNASEHSNTIVQHLQVQIYSIWCHSQHGGNCPTGHEARPMVPANLALALNKDQIAETRKRQPGLFWFHVSGLQHVTLCYKPKVSMSGNRPCRPGAQNLRPRFLAAKSRWLTNDRLLVELYVKLYVKLIEIIKHN